ncbi:hypothetical protein [Rhizobium sp. BK251]|uniref:hypothetical protein n=1 Tax=Rhizobium sp. BK251 TaxID=2512125 RepID=UPI001052244B|nr:hypothetical protein [Rhizobium sp. BK251]TCL64674.1 hypothetical protein EV286_11495 [Rhizobium sp. BK251]
METRPPTATSTIALSSTSLAATALLLFPVLALSGQTKVLDGNGLQTNPDIEARLGHYTQTLADK